MYVTQPTEHATLEVIPFAIWTILWMMGRTLQGTNRRNVTLVSQYLDVFPT